MEEIKLLKYNVDKKRVLQWLYVFITDIAGV